MEDITNNIPPSAPPAPKLEEHLRPPTEYEDEEDVFEEKMKKLISLVKESKHFILFSGAGISTAAGFPDYRGDKGLDVVTNKRAGSNTGWRSALTGLGVGPPVMDVMFPTYSHVATAKLSQVGKLKYVVTSNHDNFHIRAGLNPKKISAIFGNCYIETCVKCKNKYLRHVQVPQIGRKCDNSDCNGGLKKEGVRFDAMIPEKPLNKAYKHATKGDLALVLGSSMTVYPFCDMPGLNKKKKFVLVSLQDTTYDKDAEVKINAKCDKVMKRLMEGLGLEEEVKEYTYQQRYTLSHKYDETNSEIRFEINGGRINEPVTCIDHIEYKLNKKEGNDDEKEKEKEEEKENDDDKWYIMDTKSDLSIHNVILNIKPDELPTILKMIIHYREEYKADTEEIEYILTNNNNNLSLSSPSSIESKIFSKTITFNTE